MTNSESSEGPPNFDQVLEAIRSRGNWRVVIRPEEFDADRVSSLAELESAVRKASVSMRGWSFPVVGRTADLSPVRVGDRVQQQLVFEWFLECWVILRSGQFAFRGAIKNDWIERQMFGPEIDALKGRKALVVGDTLFRLMEIFEFAGRLSETTAGDERMVIEILLEDLEGRSLVIVDQGRAPFMRERKCHAKSWQWESVHAREELLSDSRVFSARAAISLFEQFQFDVGEEFVLEYQRALLR